MGSRNRKTIIIRRKEKVGGINRTRIKQRGVEGINETSGTLNWNARYGNLGEYKRQCAIAHQFSHQLCCVCLVNSSEELHHAEYGNDIIGETVFPVCKKCHETVCHSTTNWIKDKSNPVWGNHNTAVFISRLKLGYQLLYKGIYYHE